jgi:predicted DCC family thiol-disulfide oxidoreductase YuxK
VVDVPSRAPSGSRGDHLVLYDGVCGLCNRLTQFILAHDRRRIFDFASLQSEVGRAQVARFGGDPDNLTSFYVVSDYRQAAARLRARSRAALFVAGALGWPWNAAGMLGVLPTAVLDPLYNLVARHRYQVFGQMDQCTIPKPEYRSRFID